MEIRMLKCPKCGKFRRTNAKSRAKCFTCGYDIDVHKSEVTEASYIKEINKPIHFK